MEQRSQRRRSRPQQALLGRPSPSRAIRKFSRGVPNNVDAAMGAAFVARMCGRHETEAVYEADGRDEQSGSLFAPTPMQQKLMLLAPGCIADPRHRLSYALGQYYVVAEEWMKSGDAATAAVEALDLARAHLSSPACGLAPTPKAAAGGSNDSHDGSLSFTIGSTLRRSSSSSSLGQITPVRCRSRMHSSTGDGDGDGIGDATPMVTPADRRAFLLGALSVSLEDDDESDSAGDPDEPASSSPSQSEPPSPSAAEHVAQVVPPRLQEDEQHLRLLSRQLQHLLDGESSQLFVSAPGTPFLSACSSLASPTHLDAILP